MNTKKNIYSKIVILSSVLCGLVACGGTGYNKTKVTTPTTSDNKGTFQFALTGNRTAGSAWACEANVVVNPGGKEFRFTDRFAGQVTLANGNYTADVDVDCKCEAVSAFYCSGLSSGIWIPSLEVFGIENWLDTRTLPGQAANGLDARIYLTVKDGSPTVDSGQTASALSSSATKDMEMELVSFSNKDASGQPADFIECTIDYDQAWYGGFGFHNVKVKNISNETLPSWTVSMIFEDAEPDPQWSWGTSNIQSNGDNNLMISGSTSLSPGEVTTFGVGGNYTGANNINVDCL